MSKNFNDVEIIASVFIPENAPVFLNCQNSALIIKQKNERSTLDLKNTIFIRNDSTVPVNDFNFIIDFKNEITEEGFQKIKFSYINNPDGSIRWIYPESNKYPSFLGFYNASTQKAKLFKYGILSLFKIGLKNIVRSGSFTLIYKEELNSIVSDLIKTAKVFSVFTGTIGLSRKIQIEVCDEGKKETSYYIKLPFTKYSKHLILNEKKNLIAIELLKLKFMKVPTLLDNNDKDLLYTKNLKIGEVKNSTIFSSIHSMALDELYSKTLIQSAVASLHCIKESKKNVEWLKKQNNFKFDKSLLNGLTEILNLVDKKSYIPTSRAHKDFTPWNMYIGENGLSVFDWEASESGIPLLYDFFHFHFQTGILIERHSFDQILELINERILDHEIQEMILKYAIDVEQHLIVYLVVHVSEYLVLYQKQEKLHVQVKWLVTTWSDAVRYLLINHHKDNLRQYFIENFIASLSDVPYAWLKYEGKILSAISEDTDIDLLIEKSSLNKILTFIDEFNLFGKIKYIKKSNMTTVNIYFHNQEFLSIDLVYEFKRKHYYYLDSRKILKNTCLNADGVMVPQRHFDFEYILLFYTLNYSCIPFKYFTQFSALLLNEKRAIMDYVNQKYSSDFLSLEDLMNNNLSIRDLLFKSVKGKLTKNKFVNYLFSVILYIKDFLIDFFFNKGFVMTVSGVDGAGKSTVIDALKNDFERKFRKKVKILRHRPSLFPILSSYVYGKEEAEQMATNTLPRQGSNKSVFGSLLRFAYYFMDYQIGQIYIYFKYVCRGYIVIYDRYYFDFIQDSRRTNIYISPVLTGFLYRFIYKPRLNVLLYADPEVILSRKKELTELEIIELTYSYRKLFNKLSLQYREGLYLIIENINKDTTVKFIIKKYCNAA